jgi:hypothetical protein
VYQGNGYGPILDSPLFDYYPAAVRLHAGDLRVWTCTKHKRNQNDLGQDAIYVTVFNTDHPTAWQQITYGPAPSLLPGASIDLNGACAPSVVSLPGTTQYRMYYECDPVGGPVRVSAMP